MINRALFTLILAAATASAQAPKIPEAQRRFCEVLENWELRGGYAAGAEPKVDPNPVKAAQAPKPPDPGNLFDQLVQVFGEAGTLTGWKGTVTFGVYEQKVRAGFQPYCPPPAQPLAWIDFETQAAHALSLNSPPAQFLSTAKNGDMVTFSGRVFYVPATRFYSETVVDPRGIRNLGPELFFVRRRGLFFEVTGITK